MSTIQDLFQQAQLAEAAYANFAAFPNNSKGALEDEGFSTAQATEFVNHWKVASHQQNTTNGFSATLFESLDHPGTYTYSVRGTEPATASDLLSADIYGIGGQGFAVYQALDMYNSWQSLTHTGNYKAAALQTAQAETSTLSALWAATQVPLPLPGAMIAYEAKRTEFQNAGFLVDGGAVSRLVLGDSTTLLAGTPLAAG